MKLYTQVRRPSCVCVRAKDNDSASKVHPSTRIDDIGNTLSATDYFTLLCFLQNFWLRRNFGSMPFKDFFACFFGFLMPVLVV